MRIAWVRPFTKGYSELEPINFKLNLKTGDLIKYERENGSISIGQIRSVCDGKVDSETRVIAVYREEKYND